MKEMSKIVNTVTNFGIPFIITFGIYIIIHGHLTPGGGFQGGAVLATSIALLLVSRGYSENCKLNEKFVSSFELFGLLMFLGLALMGLSVSGVFDNFLANGGVLFGNSVIYGINTGNFFTGGTVPLMNMAVGMEVVGAIGTILLLFTAGFQEEDD